MIFMSAYLLVFSLQLAYVKLSHWVHFTVCRYICVYVCVFCVFSYCVIVRGTRWETPSSGPDGIEA